MNERQWRFLRDIALLVLWAERQGFMLTAGNFYRDTVQNSAVGGTENSRHLLRMAADLNLFIGGEYLTATAAHAPLGEYWESLDPCNRWGGRYDDGNHYERLDRPREG